MESIPVKTFYGKKLAVAEYRHREIPDGSSDSELSDNEVVEPTQGQSVDHFDSDEEDISETDPEDSIPLSRFQTPTVKKKKKVPLKWKKTTTQKSKREFLGSELLPADILQLNNPYKLFNHFFSREFITEIVR